MAEQPLAAALVACLLALVHVFAGRLRFLSGVPRSRWLSIAGGISIAYVFAHLLPELSTSQEAVAAGARRLLPFLENHVFLLALLGFAVFYGVEASSRRSRARRGGEAAETGGPALALSVGSFAVYNAVIGYLLVHREEPTLRSLLLFALAMGVHFVVNDFGLREHHKNAYERIGRWALALAVLLGLVIGMLTVISEAAIGLLLAFLGGGVILNVVKEELPRERESRFHAFIAGGVGYAALLQFV